MAIEYTDEETAAITLALGARLDVLPESLRREIVATLGTPPDVGNITDATRAEVAFELQDKIRRRVDAEFKRTVERLSEKQRREIVAMGGDPPPQWWTENQKEMEQAIFLFLVSAYGLSASWHGVPQKIAEIQSGQYARRQAYNASQAWTDTTRRKLGEYHSDAAKDAAATQLNPDPDAATAQRVEDHKTGKGLRDRLDRIFNPARAEAMTTTEVTMAVTMAGESFDNLTDRDRTGDRWFTRLDDRVCPVCLPLHGTSRAMWGEDYPNGPPAHPYCRCRIQYGN